MCDHKWMVFSTSLVPPTIMVYCPLCGIHGRVEDYSAEEWGDAFYAPDKNYRWHDDKRVVAQVREAKA